MMVKETGRAVNAFEIGLTDGQDESPFAGGRLSCKSARLDWIFRHGASTADAALHLAG